MPDVALYPAAVKKLIKPTSNDPLIDPDTAVLHVDAGNAASLYGWFNGPSGGIESHFHVRRDGIVEQYRDTAYQADAQMARGKDAISVETQGYDAGEWTPEQLAAIKALLLWITATHKGIPLRRCTSPAGPGIGYHSQFPEWSGDGRTCPGRDRIIQFRTILVPWMANPQEEDMPSADEVADVVLKRRVVDYYGHDTTVGEAIGITLRNSTRAAIDAAVARASAEAGRQLSDEEVERLAERTAAELGQGYDAVLVPKKPAPPEPAPADQ